MAWQPSYSWTGAPTEFNGTDAEYGGDSGMFTMSRTKSILI